MGEKSDSPLAPLRQCRSRESRRRSVGAYHLHKLEDCQIRRPLFFPSGACGGPSWISKTYRFRLTASYAADAKTVKRRTASRAARPRGSGNGNLPLRASLRLQRIVDHEKRHGKDESASVSYSKALDRNGLRARRRAEISRSTCFRELCLTGALPAEPPVRMGGHPPTSPSEDEDAPDVPPSVEKFGGGPTGTENGRFAWPRLQQRFSGEAVQGGREAS